MDYGLALPNMLEGSSAEGIEAAAEVAERLGYTTVWTTDHVLVDHSAAGEYGRIFDAILTLAHVAGRTTKVRLGTSVIVVPQRQAVVLAKELATLDVLSRGRLTAGVGSAGASPNSPTSARPTASIRGARTSTRRSASGATSGPARPSPSRGASTTSTDFVFAPLPVQAGGIPILVGGGSEAALRRAGRTGDGYHFSATAAAKVGERLTTVRAAAEEAGRPMPPVSGRVTTLFDATEAPPGVSAAAMGSSESIAATMRGYADVGVGHLMIVLRETDPARYVAKAERFMREVVPLVG